MFVIFHIFTQLCRELHCQCVCYSWETDSVVFVLNFRAYIEFEKPRFADQGLESNAIVPAVYKAIKMRLVSISLGHFRIVFCLGIKMSVRVKPFKWTELCLANRFIFMLIKLVFAWKVLSEDSF